jgi:16S rRNA (cytosine1402-N4)-methyltransferase
MTVRDGYHDAVMPEETLEHLVLHTDGTYLDATLGGAGHARLILAKLGEKGRYIGLDRDPEALARSGALLEGDARVALHASRFADLGQVASPESLDGALFDLGVSSRQLDARERGFTFVAGAALDMRMDPTSGESADAWIRQADEETLATAFFRNSDLQRSRNLARTVISLAAERAVLTSDDLRAAVDSVYRPKAMERNGLLARVFQAIRMEVNSELQEISKGLQAAVTALKVGGRLVVMSYHSVEDRAVKVAVAGFEQECICPPGLPICRCGGNHRKLRKVLRKPLTASEDEIRRNPRARSAKLRVLEKVA